MRRRRIVLTKKCDTKKCVDEEMRRRGFADEEMRTKICETKKCGTKICHGIKLYVLLTELTNKCDVLLTNVTNVSSMRYGCGTMYDAAVPVLQLDGTLKISS